MSAVTYTLADLTAAAANAAGIANGADFDSGNAQADLVNDAIQQLAGEHDWSWLRKPLVLSIAITAATSISRTSNVLTVTSNAHGLVAGDFIRITGSTSADGQYYVVTAATNTFTLNQSGSDEALATPGSWIPGFIALPADFAGLRVLQRNGGQFGPCVPTGMQRLTQYRTNGGIYSIAPSGFLYAVRTIPQISATTSPTKRLELYPTPLAAETVIMAGEYTRFVPKVSGGTAVADIALNLFPCLRRLCRALAISTEEERAGEDWRMYERMLATAISRDGDEQPNLGQLQGGVDDVGGLERDYLYPFQITPAS